MPVVGFFGRIPLAPKFQGSGYTLYLLLICSQKDAASIPCAKHEKPDNVKLLLNLFPFIRS